MSTYLLNILHLHSLKNPHAYTHTERNTVTKTMHKNFSVTASIQYNIFSEFSSPDSNIRWHWGSVGADVIAINLGWMRFSCSRQGVCVHVCVLFNFLCYCANVFVVVFFFVFWFSCTIYTSRYQLQIRNVLPLIVNMITVISISWANKLRYFQIKLVFRRWQKLNVFCLRSF